MIEAAEHLKVLMLNLLGAEERPNTKTITELAAVMRALREAK